MKYEAPKKMKKKEIDDFLLMGYKNIEELIEILLSFIYYSDSTECVGDLIIKEFESINDKYKSRLVVLLDTYYAVRRTTYRIGESICILEDFNKNNNINYNEVYESIDNLKQYKEVFK